MIHTTHNTGFVRWLALLLVALATAVVLATAPALAAGTVASPPAQDTTLTTSLTDVYNAVSPSVVAINVIKGASQNSPFNQPQAGSGSGFVLDTAGHIITNDHVVDGATSIEVEFFDGTLARGEIVGTDPDSDVAVIQVNLPAEKLVPVTWADSDALQIGQTVLAIGSPFGQRWTLTTGIVSGLERTISGMGSFSIPGVIQTDAAINPGNSGGPLLDELGRVIGINSQIATASGSNSGVGFAVPGNLAQRVARDLIDKGYVEYSFLGITGGDVNLDLIEALELPNDVRGVVVSDVTNGGPADRAGLRPMTFSRTATGSNQNQQQGPLRASDIETVDIITAVNGQPLTGINALISYLVRETRPGDTVTLTVLRNGTETVDLTATLRPR